MTHLDQDTFFKIDYLLFYFIHICLSVLLLLCRLFPPYQTFRSVLRKSDIIVIKVNILTSSPFGKSKKYVISN